MSKQDPGDRGAVLVMMTSSEVAEHLWNGERSVAKRAVVGAAAQLAGKEVLWAARRGRGPAREAGRAAAGGRVILAIRALPCASPPNSPAHRAAHHHTHAA